MKKDIKKIFFIKYKQKNVFKYKKIFLSKIKSLLFYFIKFFKDGLIFFKIYCNNYIIGKFNQKFIIIIIYNKNIFFTNDDYQKI